MPPPDQWYIIDNIHQIDSPALVIYKDRVKENIRLLKAMVNDTARLRPHVKTNKIAEVCQLMLDEGIQKFKCATIAEAEMLAFIGAPDVLLAYQPVGPKVQRFQQLVKAYPKTNFSCLIDNVYSAQQIAALFNAAGLTAHVFIDLNIGMNRTGIQPADAFALYNSCSLFPGIRIAGLHAYDGHINDANPSVRREKTERAFEAVAALAGKIETVTGSGMIIVAGGSPTSPIHALRKEVECSPGTFVFWDWNYKNTLADEPFDYAALVVTRIVSVPDEETICVDLGHKSVAAENPLPRVYFLNIPDAKPVAQSEEHLVIRVNNSYPYKPGDVLYGVPAHICPTVALYDKAYVAENGRINGSWKVVARDRSINI